MSIKFQVSGKEPGPKPVVGNLFVDGSGNLNLELNGVVVLYVGHASGRVHRWGLTEADRANLPGVEFNEDGRIFFPVD